MFLTIQIKISEKQNEKREVKKIKRYLKEEKCKFLFGKKTLKIDSEKIYIKSELIEVIKDKKSIKDVKIYDDLIVLYESRNIGEIIPRRYIKDDTIKDFISIVQN